MRESLNTMLNMVVKAMRDPECGAEFRGRLRTQFNLAQMIDARPAPDPYVPTSHMVIPTLSGNMAYVEVSRLLEMQQNDERYMKIRPIISNLTFHTQPSTSWPGHCIYLAEIRYDPNIGWGATDPDSVDACIDNMPMHYEPRAARRSPYATPYRSQWQVAAEEHLTRVHNYEAALLRQQQMQALPPDADGVKWFGFDPAVPDRFVQELANDDSLRRQRFTNEDMTTFPRPSRRPWSI